MCYFFQLVFRSAVIFCIQKKYIPVYVFSICDIY